MSLSYPSLNTLEDAQDWSYVGEGNQNIVVRYIGSNVIFRRKVLRIAKTHHNPHDSVDDADVIFQLKFIEDVIKPLIGNEYVIHMVPVKTTETFLAALAQRIEQYRPAHRLKGQILVRAPTSFLMQDLTQLWTRPTLPTIKDAQINPEITKNTDAFTIELKPKWGFKPSASNIHSIKTKYCRFCMHAHMRKFDIHAYCPLDLYSNDQKRLKKALDALLDQPILRQKTLKITPQQSNFERDKLQDILLNILLKDPILCKLKNLQKKLDSVDIENIIKLYKPGITIGNDIRPWKVAIANYINRQSTENSVEEKLYKYVLSMTFKDCSIMINVATTTQADIEENSEVKYVTIGTGNLYKYDVKLIDIDLKKIEKIPHWYELDKSIVQYAVDTKFSKKSPCEE
ncbi:inositol-pentakisphosphate 2-kinase [Mycotypha africana]|uniref:inositol-pentakisphosphate 2-kinase n=1 Tax=Mycotypha africana TaxID=64632 RepID=UPI0023008043|nr:inositol-pentakisphosphate 2-kinase [Mycotypha africana]KAI8967025.1 inositol-pentakisphosphate 2-kinase [Mycotypha africana]